MPTVPPPSRDTTLDPGLFWFRHKTELLAALLVLVLGGAGFVGYRVYADHRDSAAAEFLAKAKTIPEYRQVIDRYPGTPGWRLCLPVFGGLVSGKKGFPTGQRNIADVSRQVPRARTGGHGANGDGREFRVDGKTG